MGSDSLHFLLCLSLAVRVLALRRALLTWWLICAGLLFGIKLAETLAAKLLPASLLRCFVPETLASELLVRRRLRRFNLSHALAAELFSRVLLYGFKLPHTLAARIAFGFLHDLVRALITFCFGHFFACSIILEVSFTGWSTFFFAAE